MTAGETAANANTGLTTLAGAGTWVQLHKGDPGSAGTANVSSVTARQQVTWGTAAGGSVSATNTPSWGAWAGTSPETLTHISIWSLSSAGVFEQSIALSSPVTVTTGTVVSLGQLTLTQSPLAA